MDIDAFPAPFVVHPKDTHSHSLIFLHGRGDTGSNFGSLFFVSPSSSDFTLAQLYGRVKWIWPTTKVRFSSRFRCHINQWFDVHSLAQPETWSDLQLEGLREAVHFVHGLIRDEMDAGIPPERIMIGGISQGCATALHVVLSFERRLGGFVGIAGWLPFANAIRAIVAGAAEKHNAPGAPATPKTLTKTINFIRQNLGLDLLPPEQVDSCSVPEMLRTPVFLCHGDADKTVNIAQGKKICSVLLELGMDVTFKTYCDYGHSYKVPETIDDIMEFWGEKSDLLPS